MKYLLLPLLAFAVTSCNQSNCCTKKCPTVCETETTTPDTTAATEPMATEEPAVAEAPAMETSKEAVATKLEMMSTTFAEMITTKFNVIPLLTTTTMPVNGVTTMLSTADALDITTARKMIIETASTLLDVANNNEAVKEVATTYPLTTNDLDVIIDSSNKETSIRSVSLIRGMIEYEGLDEETKTYRIVKQEPLNHAQAKAESKTCCGSYFVAK